MACRSYLASLAIATFSVLLVSSPAFAQRPGGRGGSIGELLRSEEVRDELEIVDDQLEDLREIEQEVRGEMREMFSGMRDLGPEERREKWESMREQMQELRSSVDGRVKEVLLPHQFERLEQIHLQQSVQRRGMSATLSGPLAEKLGLTEEQQQQISEKAQELQAEMQEKINQIRQDARNELLEMLTSEQRAKLEELQGETFDMPNARGRFGRGQFDRAGGRGPRGGGQRQGSDAE